METTYNFDSIIITLTYFLNKIIQSYYWKKPETITILSKIYLQNNIFI